jgi:hypothetical protein
MRNFSERASVAVLFFFSCLPVAAQLPDWSSAGPCTNPKLTRYSVSANSTGDTVEGGVCVEISPVNRLRNFVYISTTITQTVGPSPASVFSSSDKQTPSSGAVTGVNDLDGLVAAVETRWRTHENAVANLDDLLARLKEFVLHSDESVLSGEFASLVREIKTRKAEIDDALDNKKWQPTDDILINVHSVRDRIADFRTSRAAALTDSEKGALDALTARLNVVESKASTEVAGSDQAKAVATKIGQLQYWTGVLGTFLEPDKSLPKDPAGKFAVHQDVSCKTMFNFNRETAVKLTVGDRMPFFDGQPMSMQTHDALITVKCASPFSLSAGVAFSLIEQREFAIQQSPVAPGSATTVNTFGYSARSTVHPLPLAMAHMRIREWDEHRFAVHASFGVAANVQGTNAGGSDAEYLPSVSLSLFRTMFLSVGLHIGKQASLAGGFKVGDQVPASVTSPPIQTSYKAGPGFAITFTKP